MMNKRAQTSKKDVLMNKRREFGPPVGRYNTGVTITINYKNERNKSEDEEKY